MKIISDFARRTGDLEVLSRPDVHLMALAYELECERNHGDWRLRSVPGQKRLNGAPPTSLTEGAVGTAETKDEASETVGSTEAAVQDAAVPADSGSALEINTQATDIEEQLAETHISNESPETVPAVQPSTTQDTPQPDAIEEVEVESEASDDEGWITPSNLKQHQQKDANGASEPQEEPKTMQVALITSDFAMQNVLLRMNLNLLSPSLQRIRQLKTWVLRCHACFFITRDMDKQFCVRCGKPTLLRTSCSTDKDGNFKVHLKKNMQWNNRGNVFSVPKPVAGTSNGKLVAGGGKGGWGQGLILAEDQKEYVQAMTSARRKKEKDLMDEDYLPGILSGDRGRAGGRPRVGAGKNVNSKKRNKQ